MKNSKKFEFLFYFLIVIILSLTTYKRNETYQNEYTIWQDVIKKSPNKPRGYYFLSHYLRKIGNISEANKQYNITLQIFKKREVAPKDFEILYNLGVDYYDQKDYHQAKIFFEESIAINPYIGDAYFFLGNIYFKWNMYDEAINEYNLALESDIKFHIKIADIWMNLGQMYYRKLINDEEIKKYRIEKQTIESKNAELEKVILKLKNSALESFKNVINVDHNYPRKEEVNEYINFLERF